MNIFKWLFKKYQAYKDRKFKERLERVLKDNSINTSLVIRGTLFVGGSIHVYVPQKDIDEFERNKNINNIFNK